MIWDGKKIVSRVRKTKENKIDIGIMWIFGTLFLKPAAALHSNTDDFK